MLIKKWLSAFVFFGFVASAWATGPILSWSADDLSADKFAERLVDLHNGKALHFEFGQADRYSLGQGPDNVLCLDGPFTLSAVVQVGEQEVYKAAIVSKWKLAAGGRSYELGITRQRDLFFTVSGSGSWDEQARQVVSDHLLKVDTPYLVTAIYQPGERMALFINGIESGIVTTAVPESIFDSKTPVCLGERAGGNKCELNGSIQQVRFYSEALRKKQIAARAKALNLTHKPEPLPFADAPHLPEPYDLDRLRDVIREWYTELHEPGKPYGAYRLTKDRPADMYASADLAWSRWSMNDLQLTEKQRSEWIDFIQDQQNPDGTYNHITGHCKTHAFCQATGALNMLGGKQRYAPTFLDKYRNIERIDEWLDNIDWVHQWGASHDIWGAGVPLACTPQTPQAWRDKLFAWLDREASPKTGYWRVGVKAASELEYVGGAFHIWPIYAARGRMIPYPKKVVDHILSLQKKGGSFDGVFHYGGMDCVWALVYVTEHMPYKRQAIKQALARNADGIMKLYNEQPHRFFIDAHGMESRILTIAMLQQALPEKFKSTKPWRNPWHKCSNFVIRVEEDK
jgi:hypothetical protein